MPTKTTLKEIKLNKRVKIAVRRSNADSETLNTEKKEFRRKKTSSDDGFSVKYENNKLYKRDSNDETLRGGRYDHKRKRVFSDRSNNEDRVTNGSFRKVYEKNGTRKPDGLRREQNFRESDSFDRNNRRDFNRNGDGFDRVEKGKGMRREGKFRESDSFDRGNNRRDFDRNGDGFDRFEKGKGMRREGKSRESDSFDRGNNRRDFDRNDDRFERGEKGRGLRKEGKSREHDSFDRLISVKKRDFDRKGDGERLNKRDGRSEKKEMEQNHDGREVSEKRVNVNNDGKESIWEVRGLNDKRRGSKKRGIGIHPYEISNKRLDDEIITSGEAEKKEENIEKDKSPEMSMNAQFRAIIPSPSILSFVQDNYLGRRRMIELSRAGYNTELPAPLDNIPSSKSSDRERIEEPVFRNKLTFFAAANISSSFPAPDLPEIAFAGRSNVGKSSMLNALTRQWGVARTSDKPGLTQTINFFKLGPKVSLVDLPGYGFAFAKDEVKEAWEELVKEYVSTRVGLKRVCLLIDTKWGMKPRDIELIDLMERSQTKYQIVLTKTDLVFPIDVARRAMQIEESLKKKKSAVQPVMMVSSKSGAGIRTLRTVLSKIARIVKV